MNPPAAPAALTVLTVLTITDTALADLSRHTAAQDDGRETGGILLGHHHEHRIDITEAGGPGPNALHSATRFRRDLTHAQDLAAQAYSRDHSIWVGEWHTHPLGPPAPSALDLRTYLGLLAEPDLELSVFVALIAAPPPSPVPGSGHPRDVHAWLIDSATAVRTSLHVVGRR